MAKAIVAGMAGMAAAKFIPTLIPGQFVQGNLMRTIATGASAFVAQMIARAVVKDQTVADAVLFGGLIQTGSVALNAFLPAIARQVGLAGIMNADWSIPENPLRALPVAAPVAMSGLARAYGGY